jgi:4,5-DOPA dioxygenase extradiol
MQRKTFIKTSLGALAGMGTLSALARWSDGLGEEDVKMPVLFIGHGSPMNGIEDNAFSQYWKALAARMPVPKAVLCVSAHWLTKGTAIIAMAQPRTIHDFGGFPKALFEVQYPAPGDPALATLTRELVKKTEVHLDHEWGLDHGCWTIVRHMYPNAQIPVLQLSIDYHKPAEYHYALAAELQELRKKGVLIMGSGNMVHNLRMAAFDKIQEPDYGYDWAIEMNEFFKQKIADGDHKTLLQWETMHKAAKLAIPTPDHYYPLLYTLGLQNTKDKVSFFNDQMVAGSLNMTSVLLEYGA